jgi:hypothetical protein
MTLLPYSLAALALAGAAFLPQDPGKIPAGAIKRATQSGGPLLRVTQSDKDLEQQIGKYFSEEKGWKVDYSQYGEDENDLLLEVSFGSDEAPPISFLIDVVPAAKQGDQITESRVRIQAWFTTEIGPDHPKRVDWLEALNAFNAQYWMPHRTFLDGDGDLWLDSNINIPGADYPVHPELIADAVIRTAYAWETLAEHLRGRNLPVPKF